MQNKKARAIVLGMIVFIGLLIAKIISKDPFSFKTLVPPLVGGLVAGLVVYFLAGNFLKKKN
jgi:hypothetical protein